MNLEEHAQECNNALSDLIGKEIFDIEKKINESYDGFYKKLWDLQAGGFLD